MIFFVVNFLAFCEKNLGLQNMVQKIFKNIIS